MRGFTGAMRELARQFQFEAIGRALAAARAIGRRSDDEDECDAATSMRANSDVVLVVDDVPDNLSVLHDALDESGYTVLVATSGEAALQRAAQALPDIVLLDAMMPGLDGFEVAKRLKAGRRRRTSRSSS
jgi:PleD family two-component response regulator